MSAYIVSPLTMNRVVCAVLDTCRGADIRTFAGVHTDDPNAPAAIGSRLYRLNADAVALCYNQPETSPVYVHNVRQETKIQQFKSVQCLLYQMTEGDVPEHPTYKELEGIAKRLACAIVYTLPEWMTADWG